MEIGRKLKVRSAGMKENSSMPHQLTHEKTKLEENVIAKDRLSGPL
jgi:hypothetical protein